MAAITLHIATPDDADAVTALFKRSYATFLVDDYAPDVLERGMAFLARANPDLLASGTYYLAKTEAGDVVGAGGWTAVRPGSDDADVQTGLAHVRHFAVDPAYARMGIASMLFDRCVEDAKASENVTRFECYSTLSARRFYETRGFRVIGDFAAPFAPDFSFPSLHMVCDLD
ncbi:GNAT family N-acetyltransferase [Thalassospira sp.]|uniref:GNAT family N-acetyltransferase n=1 Tax=Thalassospira sp. TaxID=1912094 RepID=UPI000C4828E1|nr:GNAT family N-acetyltransferase [Thalassospira sp.]MBC07591.1 GNAT family N-acetyltransferase [Thalassospira sp.]|tara:strand:- start:41159 stop:41674 length:516 start_codon:yes stop_codon:yes gene_type:complete